MKNRILLIAAMFCICLLSALSFTEGTGCSISVYTDKPAYIPTDRIYIYGSIESLCENAANTDIGIEVTGPGSSNKIIADQVRTSQSGLYSTSFVAPLSIESGTYTISVSCKEASNTDTFEIESVFDTLTIDTGKEKYIKGEKVEIEGTLVINGAVYEDGRVAITVKDKDGNIVYVSEALTDSQGEFADGFRIAHSMQTGEYMAYAAYNHLIETSVFQVYPNLIINEVMFYPPGDDVNLEFIEFYNPYDEEIDMDGWYIKSSWGAVYVIAGEYTLLAPGFFAVVMSDDSSIGIPENATYFNAGESILGGLSNTGGTITLFDADDNMIDSFTYKSTYGSDRDTSSVIDSLGEGSSLERIDPYVLTNYYANWDTSISHTTPGFHNTVYRGHTDADISLLFADMPRYAMEGRNIDVNTRVMNNGPMYDIVTGVYTMNGLFIGTDAILVDPATHKDNTYQFMSAPGDYELNVSTLSSIDSIHDGDVKNGMITVVPSPDNDSYDCQLLLPAIVPRNNTFHVIALLINSYDDDVTGITVGLALPQAGGFVTTDAPLKMLDTLEGNSFDASIVYSVQALADTPDELLGTRTFSVYSEGSAGSEMTWDTSFSTTEIINHSSPVLSLDLNIPKNMDVGETYELIGAAFNSGTESSRGLIITIDSPGIDIVSSDVIVFDELESSSFEMYSFEITPRYAGDHEIILEIRDQDDNSYVLQKTLNFRGVEDDEDSIPEETGGSTTTSYSTSGNGALDDTEDEPDNDAREDDISEDTETTHVDERYAFVDDDAPSEDDVQDAKTPDSTEKTPTGNVSGFHMTSRLAAALLGSILLIAILFHSKKKDKIHI